jgi:hypothetical protein
LRTCDIDRFKLGQNTQFPTDKQAILAEALACSKLIKLTIDSVMSPEFFVAFRQALTSNSNSVLEKLFFDGDSQVLGHYCRERSFEDKVLDQHDPEWLKDVNRTLTLNIQRRMCLPLFASIDETTNDESRTERIVEAIAALDMPIVYEYIRRNACNLQGWIQQIARSTREE